MIYKCYTFNDEYLGEVLADDIFKAILAAQYKFENGKVIVVKVVLFEL